MAFKDIRLLQVLEEAAERVRGRKTDAGTLSSSFCKLRLRVLLSPKENEELQMAKKYAPHTRPSSFRFGSVLGIGSSLERHDPEA